MLQPFIMGLWYGPGAIILALLEIEIEGKYGWAENLPTWYRVTTRPAKIWSLFFLHKPLTGYHLFLIMFMLWVFHIQYFSGTHWTFWSEFITLSRLFLWFMLEDYVWFVLNPHYKGLDGKIWWHAEWILGLPGDYLYGLIGSFALGCFAELFRGSDIRQMLINFGLYAGSLQVFASAARYFAPRYHRFHQRMREMDERKKARIYH